MPWKIVERRIGRAGSIKQRLQRQQQWDKKYGRDNWLIGYVIHDEFMAQEDAFEQIYQRSYAEHFQAHPSDLQELINTAKTLRNPHAEITTGVDLQVPAIIAYLNQQGLKLQGTQVLDIGSYGNALHPLSIRLSPLQIKAYGYESMSLESFWQEKKCLAIWVED